jgi:thioredoxin 1
MATVEITADNFQKTIEKPGIGARLRKWCGCRAFRCSKASKRTAMSSSERSTPSQQTAGAAQIQAIPTLMLFRDGVLLFRESGALPPAALEELVTQAKGLDMDKVREEIKNHEHEHEHGPGCDHDH